MKIFIFIGLLFCTALSFSQTKASNELVAEGSAKIKVKPDIAILRIYVEKENEVEKIAIKELNEEVEKVQKIFTKLGFNSKDIRISDYSVSNNRYEKVKKPYNASNTLTVTLGIDYKLIDAFYQNMQSGNFQDVTIQFSTEASNQLEKNSRKKLVQLAIEDAKSNAENIANSLNVKISNIKQVLKNRMRYDNYRTLDKIFVVEDEPIADEFILPSTVKKTSYSKYEVKEIEMEENITIVYEIEKK